MILSTKYYDDYWCDYVNAIIRFRITGHNWRFRWLDKPYGFEILYEDK